MLRSDTIEVASARNPGFLPQRVKSLLILLWLLSGLAAVFIAFGSLISGPLFETMLAPFGHHINSDKALYSPVAYFCLLSLTYVLERRIPARVQPFFSTGLWQDILWYIGNVLFRVAVLGAYIVFLQAIYQQYLAFLTISVASTWNPAIRFAIAILFYDFLRWLSHLILHKVPVFWAFHAVHHSQRNMNLFTNARVHPVDRMISSTIRFIPLLMLEIQAPVIMAWLVFETIYPKFYHANVRLNLGPLRYLLVTPQSHRIHHAREPIYRDKNFGITFSIWDRLFGTQFSDDGVYPETGIVDPEFPHEQEGKPGSLLRTLFGQLIYPFQVVSLTRRA